jgi:DNA-binding GntR family transcriptional regulator
VNKLVKIQGYELLSQKIYREIKKQITRGFIGPGEKVYANKIAKDLNVSRTPVREALQRLSSEGLVKITPNKAMVVAEVSVEDAKEVLQVRGVLEGLAASICAKKINEKEIQKFEKIVQKMNIAVKKGDLTNYCEVDDEFHELILKICGNKRIMKIRESLDNFIYRFRVKSLSVAGRLENSRIEHKNILESLKQHESEKAEILSKEHMNNTIENIIKNVLS